MDLIEKAISELVDDEVTWQLDNDRELAGASLQGTLDASLTDIEKALGPGVASGSLSQDQRMRWVISWTDGKFAVVYDYNKTGPVYDVTQWNIAGNAPDVLNRVTEIIPS